ncbi:MAG TPA: type II toxin-antitoxin system antitoxin SocA domain-containing protein [Sumerlaeia bacterium]|nr:type II toxin-antitoxin system antitoxin SocA domain-containing protein [Sumerlaeia bacterium]
MITADDVAAYILRRCGEMTATKLEKLVYYCQTWSLVWDEEPLFLEEIEAGATGPVVVSLYNKHRGMFSVSEWPDGNPDRLSPTQRETVDAVLDYYGGKSPQWLSDLAQMEAPWKHARRALADAQGGWQEITHAAMAEYYGSLPDEG